MDVLKVSADFLRTIPEFLNLPIEKSFTSHGPAEFTENHYEIAFTCVIAYLIIVFGGREIMKNYPEYDLRIPLAIWNAGLSVFSFIGMCRTAPWLGAKILTSSFEETICENPMNSWGNGATGFWVMLFIYSKIPELIDTVFIVLRKKKLIFLHWYHHVTVLLFCWNAYATLAGSGLYFVAMNYSVHALMYGYYCLSELKCLPKQFPTIVITLSQIAQMFVGTGVCISAWYYKFNGNACHNDMSNLIAGAVMYASYLYLFVDFAMKRYTKKPIKEKKID
jgi:hypothetical protein